MRMSIVLACVTLAAGCASDGEEGTNHNDREVELKAGGSMSFEIEIDSPTHFSLVNDGQMNARIEVSNGSNTIESEWSSTAFVDVEQSGAFKIEIHNDSAESLSARLISLQI